MARSWFENLGGFAVLPVSWPAADAKVSENWSDLKNPNLLHVRYVYAITKSRLT
jgi:hypothetical protein